MTTSTWAKSEFCAGFVSCWLQEQCDVWVGSDLYMVYDTHMAYVCIDTCALCKACVCVSRVCVCIDNEGWNAELMDSCVHLLIQSKSFLIRAIFIAFVLRAGAFALI